MLLHISAANAATGFSLVSSCCHVLEDKFSFFYSKKYGLSVFVFFVERSIFVEIGYLFLDPLGPPSPVSPGAAIDCDPHTHTSFMVSDITSDGNELLT